MEKESNCDLLVVDLHALGHGAICPRDLDAWFLRGEQIVRVSSPRAAHQLAQE